MRFDVVFVTFPTFYAAKILLFIQLYKYIEQKMYFFIQYSEFIAQKSAPKECQNALFDRHR